MQRGSVAVIRVRGRLEQLRDLHFRFAEDDARRRALLDTGISANSPQRAEDRIATVDVLLARGAYLKWKDGNDNTILLFAVDCPVPVIERLIAAGTDIHAKKVMDMTPLKVAFTKGRWTVAEALVSHGARLSKKEINQLFFEKPDDPAKLALIKRATAK